jgi:hypothetical protein
MTAVVGFDRKIKLEWLDAFADRVAQDQDPAKLRTYLHESLAADHPAETARGKTVTVLMRIWSHVPPEHIEVREQAFELLGSINSKDRIWLHWGMCLMAYPLFNDMASSIGRLLRLQDDVTWGQLHRRLKEGWGERTTVQKAVPRLVSSMVDWHVLDQTETRGHFVTAPQRSTRSKRLQVWLLKAVHTAQNKELIEAHELLTLPCTFPFKITVGKADLRNSKNFELHRQGLDMDMVEMPNGRPKETPKQVKPKQGVLFGDE